MCQPVTPSLGDIPNFNVHGLVQGRCTWDDVLFHDWSHSPVQNFGNFENKNSCPSTPRLKKSDCTPVASPKTIKILKIPSHRVFRLLQTPCCLTSLTQSCTCSWQHTAPEKCHLAALHLTDIRHSIGLSTLHSSIAARHEAGKLGRRDALVRPSPSSSPIGLAIALG